MRVRPRILRCWRKLKLAYNYPLIRWNIWLMFSSGRTRNKQRSTINLIFVTQGLAERLIRCEIRENLDFNLDYKAIFLNFWYKIIASQGPRRKNWKKINTTKLIEIFTQIIRRPATPQIKEKINKYAKKIITNLLKIIN